MDEEVVGVCNMIGLFHVLIRQYFCICAGVPGLERPNHPPGKKKFHSGLGIVERDCEHTRGILQGALLRAC